MNQPWFCSNCGKENHPNSSECYECRAPRPANTYPDGQAASGQGYGPPTSGYAGQPGYGAAAKPKKNACLPVIITCSVLLLVTIIGGTCVAISLPNFIKIKEKAKEAEVKANLHNIQLSVERFAVDHDGTYPSYLIGGEAKCATQISNINDATADDFKDSFQNIIECSPREEVSDPLIREGYHSEYPANPFTRNGAAIHQVQCDLASTPGGVDILRNDSDTGLKLGTRFGPYCSSMGSVLGDVRHPRTTILRPGAEPLEILTGADTEYHYWDMWEGDKPYPYIPGMFFYKSAGSILISAEGQESEAGNLPLPADQYILGGYGGTRSKGKDVLGPEKPVTGPNGETVWTFLRSEISTSPDEVQGCPYSVSARGEKVQIDYGNPNGIRDAVILVLTDGEEYIGNSAPGDSSGSE